MRTITIFTLLIALLLLTGCGPSALPVVEITGKVTFDGKPLEAAMVTFVPVELEGRSASGVTNANGEFLLMTHGAARSGGLPGSYRVMVGKYIPVDSRGNPLLVLNETATGSGIDWSTATSETSTGASESPAGFKSVIPEKYDNVETSGLSAEVTQRGKNSFVFELAE